MHATDTDIEHAQRDDVEERIDLDQLPSLDSDQPRCECDHGTEAEYMPCGRKAKWRASIDCNCGENHPRTVELLCSRCLRTLRQDVGNDAVTARRI